MKKAMLAFRVTQGQRTLIEEAARQSGAADLSAFIFGAVKNEIRKIMGEKPEIDVFDQFVEHLKTRPIVPLDAESRLAVENYRKRQLSGEIKYISGDVAKAMIKKAMKENQK